MREAIRGGLPPTPPSPFSSIPQKPRGVLFANGGRCLGWKWNGVSYLPLLDAALALAWKRERREKADFLCLTLARFSPPKNPFLFSHPAPDSRTERGGGGGMAMLPDIDIKVTAAAVDVSPDFSWKCVARASGNAS